MAGMTAAQLRAVLFSTENGNAEATLRTFSYAGGASTYSFGLLQFDVGSNHGNVQAFLLENGFSQDQIEQLSQHGGLGNADLETLNAQLRAVPRQKLDAFTDTQLVASTERIDALVRGLRVVNPEVARTLEASIQLQLALADYDNQFGIGGVDAPAAPRNGMRSYLEGNRVVLPGGTLQLGAQFDHADIQAFIDATRYGVEHPRSVRNRERRLVTALAGLGLGEGIRTPVVGESVDSRDGFLSAGVSAPEAVCLLQTRLARLGYPGVDGRPLEVDGSFGPATQAAVIAFQKSHELMPDGIVGPATSLAIERALIPTERQKTAVRLDHPSHPGHGMYRQARACVHCLDRQYGRTPDRHSDNLSGVLAVTARAHGLACIDHVVLGSHGDRVWAVQGDLRSPFKRAVDVDVMQGLNTPLCQSTIAFEEACGLAQTLASSIGSTEQIMQCAR